MAVRLLRGMEDVVASGSQLVWTLAHQTFRRWYNRGLTPCRRFLEAWFGIGKCYQMTEGRQFQVNLLDGRKLELLVQPKLLSRDLLDLVASHFILKEKEYFGLCFTDDIGQNNWLQLDRKVLDHDFSKASGPLELNFLVRFYIDKFTFLKETTTVELFFLNAKSLVYKETIEVESENVFKLAAFALQESKGDYISNENARSDLKLLPVLPTRVLREHPSLNYCEDKVIEHYRKLKGLTRGEAIVQYLTLVESLPTYGVHYYPVKDKQEIPWWLGVSYKGIGQYDLQDKLKPRKLFQWKQLENLYFREKKFSVEVNDPHRKTVTKRTFGQTSLVIYTWYASHTLIKTIWVMAISQHQFYLDMKQSKSKMTTARSTGDIAMDLTEICHPQITKLSGSESKNHLIMASNGSLISAGSADSEVSEDQKKEKVAELKKKEKDLQEKLAKKLEELKKICLREAELTGQLPKEYPLAAGEKAPHVRRRVGTAFKLDDLFPYDEDPYLRNLESRFALQQKIVEAALKLSSEGDIAKTVKKKRKNNFLDAMRKLEEIEKEINAYRIKKGKKPTQRASLIIADDVNPSDLSSLSDSLTLDDEDEVFSQRQRSRSVQYSPRPHHADTLDIHYNKERTSNDQHGDSRLNYGKVQDPVYYGHHDALASHDSPLKLASRQPRDARSMPPTPLLTRSAFSSTHLRCEDAPQHFRQRSGSLESQSQVATEAEARVPTLVFTPAQRSNSTEVLDDGSSYTSQSSVEYSAPGNHTHRRRARGRHRKNMYANTGSMPNLAQADARCYAYQPRGHPATTAYYVTGYPGYAEPDPYSNGLYMYENEMEGHYNVSASYNPPPAAYRHRDMHTHYGNDEMDSMTHNLYATLRPPRNRPVPRSNEQVSKNIQKAAVAEHLRGWYQRNTAHKQAAYNYEYYDRGPQQCLGYQTMHGYSRNTSCSSVSLAPSSGSWSHVNGGMLEYDVPPHAPQSYSYSKASYSHSTHSSCCYSTSCLPSSSFHSSSSSPGCGVRQVTLSPSQPGSSRGHSFSRVSFLKGST
ncbi:FERM domain-containing protein 4B isoform X2 [Takifugu flavidus]|uniref:FERM domain-containing protein 4B GRP1-binding protein GRSP1 n=2 Tax=Takifugu flavidus TaxID=433684 RepID=A0A5C6N2T3_9TELE|nr:FERM domain-containing protein 4B isoform X1 [Takifugu flavidus]XP_056886783.1 FERM domain-containing protein 4B isoform X2 [Takifugu flavidus]TWW61513.1 FERM domain-containing protein 4B GRP1-binding protein GRSP1 [Takifugu flavidus]